MINSEAAKKLYKTMAGKDSQQPKDLGREWHSDGESRLAARIKITNNTSYLRSLPVRLQLSSHGGDTSAWWRYSLVLRIRDVCFPNLVYSNLD